MSDREKLPVTRTGVTHKFTICGEQGDCEYYVTANRYPDGRLGELFVKSAKHDDPWIDQWSRAVSVCLQRGSDLDEIERLFGFVQFEPQGMTDNPEIPMARSPVDYLVRWLKKEFGTT